MRGAKKKQEIMLNCYRY